MFLVWLSPGLFIFGLIYLIIGYAYALCNVTVLGAVDHLRVLFITLIWPFHLVRRLFA